MYRRLSLDEYLLATIPIEANVRRVMCCHRDGFRIDFVKLKFNRGQTQMHVAAVKANEAATILLTVDEYHVCIFHRPS